MKEETIREEAEKISREIFYSQATNGKAEGNIKAGADKIIEFSKALQLNKDQEIDNLSAKELYRLMKEAIKRETLPEKHCPFCNNESYAYVPLTQSWHCAICD